MGSVDQVFYRVKPLLNPSDVGQRRQEPFFKQTLSEGCLAVVNEIEESRFGVLGA